MHNRQSVKWIDIKVTFYGWSEWRFWKLKEEHLRMWRVNKGCVRATYTAISVTLYYSSLPLFIYAESHRIMIVPTFFYYNFPFIISVINLWINHLAFPCPAVVYNKWGRWCKHPVPSVIYGKYFWSETCGSTDTFSILYSYFRHFLQTM